MFSLKETFYKEKLSHLVHQNLNRDQSNQLYKFKLQLMLILKVENKETFHKNQTHKIDLKSLQCYDKQLG